MGYITDEQLDTDADLPPVLQKIPNGRAIAEVWNWISDLRNDLLHAGMRESGRPAKEIAADARTVYSRLLALVPGTTS